MNTTFTCRQAVRCLLFGAVLLLSLIIFPVQSKSQTTITFDTEYWLALPTTDPTYRAGSRFMISTYDDAASVTLSAPLATGFTNKSITVPANSTGTINLTNAEVALLTNGTGNGIAGTGVLIETDAKISLYYEHGSASNSPDIVALKGDAALGTSFLIPMQQASNLWTAGLQGFLVLAREDNTTVTITPKQPMTGHIAAGVPFTVTLQRGQTYFAQEPGAGPGASGSLVAADKSVAVTIFSELMRYGSAADLGAEQIVPIKHLGTEYVIVRGNRTGGDVVYFTAVEDDTELMINGSLVATLDATETHTYIMGTTVNAVYAQSTKKVTALHLTAFAAEQGISLLPAQSDCYGSNLVRVVRANASEFIITIAASTNAGFTVNGDANLLAPSVFQPVGSTGWYYARVTLPTTLVAAGNPAVVTNSTGAKFHMGVIHGQAVGGGARYGYFSSYANTVINFAEAEKVACVGESVTFTPQIVTTDPIAAFTWLDGTDNVISTDEILVFDNVTETHSGTYTIRIESEAGCTVEESVTLTVHEFPGAPVSGGDQEEEAMDPLQTLTATASLPIGAPSDASIVWYDAATAGNVVASPTFNAVGSVTYYAETVVSGVCPSTTRTPVTLTILPVEICGNGIDDDGNGLADCEDPACNPFVNYFANGSMESYSQCPNLSSAGTMAYVDFWKTSLPAPAGTGGQLMVNDPAGGCVSPRPAASWSTTTNLPAGSDGVAWAGMHGGNANQPWEDFQNTLIAPMPAGTYTFTFSAGYLIQNPYNQPGYFRFYGVKPGEPDFTTAHPLGDSPLIDNAMSSSNPAWKEYTFNFTSTETYDRIHIVAYSGPMGRSYLVFDGFSMAYNPPVIGLADPAVTCVPGAVLSVENPDPMWASFQWFLNGVAISGATEATYQPAADQVGTFTVQGVVESGCTTALSAGMTLDAVPDAPVSDGDQIVCETSPLQSLTAMATVAEGQTLTWYDAESGGNIVENPVLDAVGSVTYYAEASSTTCVSSTRTAVTLTINEKPAIVVVNPAAVCAPETVDLTAPEITVGSTAGLIFTYFMDAAATFTLTNPDVVATGGTYYIVGTAVTGCTDTAAVTVQVVSVPEVEVVHPTCIDGTGSIEIIAPLGADIEYSINGSTYQAGVLFDNLAPGTYSVTARHATAGCVSGAREAVINANPTTPRPVLVVQPDCNVPTGTVTFLAGTNLEYSIDGGIYSSDHVFENLAPGLYSFRVRHTDINCEADPVEVTINEQPIPPAAPTSGGDRVVCQASPIQTLTATAIGVAGTGIVWYDAPTGGNIVTDPTWSAIGSITYYAAAKDNVSGCESIERTAVTLTIDELPVADAGADQTQHNSGVFTLDATAPTLGTGEWSVVSGTPAVGIVDIANPNAIITLDPNTTVTLRWTVTNGTCVAFDDVVLNYVSQADIETVKTTSTTGQTTFVPGETVDYTITVTNNGPSDATAVNINDMAPAGTTITSWTAAVTTGTVTLPNPSGTGDINETIPLLPNGAVVTYTVTVQTPPDFTGNLVNAVTVTTPTEDPDPTCPVCETPPLTPDPRADIETVKVTSDAAQTTFIPGESVEYTITVTNNGPSDAVDVNINDTAPAGTAITSWAAAVTTGTVSLPNASGTGDINETIATLPNGAVITYTVTVQTPSGFTGNLVNAVTVTTPTEDPDPTCPACETPPLTPGPRADIETVKVTSDAAQTTFVPGESVEYTITVTNNGPSDAVDVNVNDTAPVGTTITSWTAVVTNGTVTLPNANGMGDLNETISVLPNGAVVTYTVTVQTPPDFTGNLVNAVTVTTPTEDPDPDCPDCETPPLTPDPQADIETVKVTSDAAQTTFVPGESVEYTITVTNNGPSDAVDVNINDTAPAGTTITNWTAVVTTGTVTLPNASGTGDINETIATLPDGAAVTYTVTVQTPPDFTGTLVNAVTVTTPTEDPDPTCDACTTPPLTPDPQADIVTVKQTSTAGQTTFIPGESVEYTITVINNGPSDATAVNINDTAPAGTTITNWTAVVTTGTVGLPVTSGTGNLDQTIATLPDGAAVTYTVTVQTPPDFTGTLVNAVTVTTPTEDPDPDCDACTTPPLTPDPQADIVTVKQTSTAGQTTFIPGESVEYTITVTNNGPSDAVDVNINDTAPTGTTITNWTAVVTTGTVGLPVTSGTGNLDQTIATLPDGAVVTYTVTVQTPPDFTGTLVNAVTVTTPTEDPDPDCDACTTPPLTPDPQADIVTVKQTSTAGQTTFVPGESVEYTITVTNNGPSDAVDVNINDTAPAGTTITGWTAAVTTGTVTLPNTSGTGDINETIATLPNGAVVTYTVTVQMPPDFTGNLVNAVTVTTPTEDPNPDCPDCETPPLTPDPQADIVTVKQTSTAGQTEFTPGESVEYTITVTNNGPSDATAVNINDTAPAGTTITSWTAVVTNGTVTLPNANGTGDLNETIPVLPNGAVVTYTVTVQTPPDFTGNLVNAVTVTTPTEDPDPDCDACTTPPLTPDPQADIVTVKQTSTAGQTTFIPGESVEYTITVTNNGPSDAVDVNINDTAPAGTTITNWTAAVTTGTVSLPNASGTGDINETIATLPDGAAVTYTVTVQTPPDFTGTLVNAVTVTTPTEDPDPDCDACTTPPLTPDPRADIVTVKQTSTAGQTTFVPGESVEYTITVTNNGPSDAVDVNINDTAPAGTAITSWTAVVTAGTVSLPNASGTGDINETIATLPDGAAVTYTVTVQTPPDFTGTLVNAVTVTTPTEDPDPDCPQCEALPLTPTPTAKTSNLRVTKTVNVSQPKVGAEVVFTIAISNTGPDEATGVVVTEMLPSGYTLTGHEATVGAYDAAQGLWNVGNLDNGATATLEIEATVNASGEYRNTASIQGNEQDPDEADNEDEVTTSPVHPPVATDDAVAGNANENFVIPIISNDSGSTFPLDPSSIEIVSQPQNGTLKINPDGTVTFKPNPRYTGPVTFSYRVKDSEGNWSNVATVSITIAPNPLKIPNVFTPNGDGQNDRFEIIGIEAFDRVELVVFNRWGNEVYRSRSYDNTWEGDDLTEGTYYFIVKLISGNAQREEKGWVLLKRK